MKVITNKIHKISGKINDERTQKCCYEIEFEYNIQSSAKDFVFSYKKSLFVGKSEDCSS